MAILPSVTGKCLMLIINAFFIVFFIELSNLDNSGKTKVNVNK